MAGEDRRADAHPEGGLLSRDAVVERGTWVADELQHALTRVDALTRELEHVEAALRAQQEEVARLHDGLQLVEGRTSRHEAGQEQTREVRQEIAALEERLEREASLRRDLAAQVERFRGRESEAQQEVHRALQLIASRLEEIDGRASADTLRQRQFAEEIAGFEQEGEGVEARVDALERRVAAEYEQGRHVGTEVARLASSVSQMLSAVDALEHRVRALTTDHHRVDEEIAALRSVRDREAELREVIEQQRATRARLEDRMSAMEEAVEEMRQSLATAAEERALLARQVSGEAEQRRALGERLEVQRDTFVEHLRRQARAQEEGQRRAIEEIERQIRASRSLLVRLAEESDETEREQPL